MWRTSFEQMVLVVIVLTDRVLPRMRERGWGRILTSPSSGAWAKVHPQGTRHLHTSNQSPVSRHRRTSAIRFPSCLLGRKIHQRVMPSIWVIGASPGIVRPGIASGAATTRTPSESRIAAVP